MEMVVSTYTEIEALLYDPRISSDQRKSTRGPPLKFRVRERPQQEDKCDIRYLTIIQSGRQS
jgi:hypothetical protein